MEKKLYRSEDNKILAGVIGGFGEYFNVDPVILRVFYVLLTVFTGFIPGIIAYILAAIVVPKPGKEAPIVRVEKTEEEKKKEEKTTEEDEGKKEEKAKDE